MPGRKYDNGSKYRFGFNGKELDNSTGEGNLDFGARIYDTRLGRWSSLDPMQSKYPDLSPYNYTANNPTNIIDFNGKDTIHFNKNSTIYPSKIVNADGLRVGGGAMGSFSVTVIQAPGKDVFLYTTVVNQLDANGNFHAGKPITKEFFPTENFSRTGITESDYTIRPGSYKDNDYTSLAKISPPDLVQYLKKHDPYHFNTLDIFKDDIAIDEKAKVIAGWLNAALTIYTVYKIPAISNIRVGQWMSEAEFLEFQQTGVIPRSNVLVKGPQGYEKQAAAGDIYAEFDMNKKLLYSKESNGNGWMGIKSKNSVMKKQALKNNITFPDPKATNITKIKKKG